MQKPGISMNLGGVDMIVPPLSLGAVELLQERLEGFTGGIDGASIKTVIDALHAALLRNYPDITREQTGELVDLGNMADVMNAVMDVSGLRRKEIEEKKAVGPVSV